MKDIELKVAWSQFKDGRTIPSAIKAYDGEQSIEASLLNSDGPEPLYAYQSHLHGDKSWKTAPNPLTFHEVWTGIATNLGIEADLHKV